MVNITFTGTTNVSPSVIENRIRNAGDIEVISFEADEKENVNHIEIVCNALFSGVVGRELRAIETEIIDAEVSGSFTVRTV